jgi:hypothetical protein
MLHRHHRSQQLQQQRNYNNNGKGKHMRFTKGNTVGFRKGRSGNPAGRAKMPEDMRELVKANTAAAVAVLVEVMNSRKSPASARVTAATALLDRGYGRPTQSVEASVTGIGPDFWDFAREKDVEAHASRAAQGS